MSSRQSAPFLATRPRRTTTTSVGACVRPSCSSGFDRGQTAGQLPRQPDPGWTGPRRSGGCWTKITPNAKRVKLVCDNLNTHTIASLYAAFPAAEAHRLARRLEIIHTPRNGSWLNVAEIELSVLARQCLDRRLPSPTAVDTECAAWETARNAEGSRVVWRFTTADARVKLKHLYPQFQLWSSSRMASSAVPTHRHRPRSVRRRSA